MFDLDALDDWRNRGRHNNLFGRVIDEIESVPTGEAVQRCKS